MRRSPTFLISVLLVTACAGEAVAWDLELRDLDVSRWACLPKSAGNARNASEAERNKSKNREAPRKRKATDLEVRSFLELAHDIDRQLGRARHRSELTDQARMKVAQLENEVVTVTGWLVWFYPGPGESTNCGDLYYHDWHLELLEESLDHAPGVGDPTALICEITPRTEADLYRRGIRLQNLAAYIRLEDNSAQATGHAAHRIRVTGFMMWDDAHNNRNEVGPMITGIDALGLGHPWRRTAWELHPIWDIIDLGTSR